MYIYRIIFPDGKSYIGSTNDFKKRKISHLSRARTGKKSKVYKAMRRFGEENLEWEILMDNASESDVEIYEGAFVSFYNSYRNGYNATKLGQGSSPKSVFNLANGMVYESIREAARKEREAHRTVQKSIENKYVTARYNLFLLEEELCDLDLMSVIRMRETIKYKRRNKLKALWPNHKRDIDGIVENRMRALQ